MHRCLLIHEILQLIADDVRRADIKSALHMALTCHAFFDAAMNALWRTVQEPAHLFLVLPERIRAVTPDHLLTILAAPSVADWKRFQSYARRVHVIHCRFIDDLGFSPSAYPTVSWSSVKRFLPPGHLLPNLRTFRGGHNDKSEGYSRFILPPLRHLFLSFFSVGRADSEHAFLRVSQCSQTLETLDVDIGLWDNPEEEVGRVLSTAITRLNVLTSLTVHVLFPEALNYLATLPTLRSLSFGLEIGDNNTSTLSFPALESLHVKSRADVQPHRSFVPHFLRRLATPVLRKLIFTYDPFFIVGPAMLPTAMYMHNVICEISWLAWLREVVIERPHPFKPDPAQLLTASLLSPLYSLTHLEVADLLPFVHHCPRLRRLGLPLSIPRVSQRTTPPSASAHAELVKLYVAKADETPARDALMFIARVFPNADVMSRGLDGMYDVAYEEIAMELARYKSEESIGV